MRFMGCTRFRQRFLSEDGSKQIEDDEFFCSETPKVRLVLLEWCPPDIAEDQMLIDASRDNDSVALERSLQCPCNPDVMHTDGGTPLHQAARAGHMAPMRLLLEAAAETDLRDTSPQGPTPLLLAASEGHVDSVDLLIEAGVDTGTATLDCGIAPLHRASLWGHLEVACLLIEGGADMNIASKSGLLG